MFFSGIADEAGASIATQIQAHREIGWEHIEIRNVDGTNLTDLSDEDFAKVAQQVEEAGFKVSCFASQLANWSRPIDTDMQKDVEELGRAVQRMSRFGTRFIRCMSYPNADPPWKEEDWRKESIRRMKILARMAEEADVILVHENCSGWGGMGPRQSCELLEEVGSDHLKLVFDTGNPAQYKQDAWEYYEAVRGDVVYVHIKDYRIPENGQEVAVFPGEGVCYVREIVKDLLERGYDGGFSIEPHITSVIHLQQEAKDPELAYRTYVEYGKRLEALVRDARAAG